MGKAIAIGEAVIVAKEILEEFSGFFSNLIPNDFYKLLDQITFLNAKFLAIGSNGKILDDTEKIASAVMNLSNFVIWGILLFYGFKSLFGYFISKRIDIPWKFFVRIIIFGVLANASFFICYTGVFFAENCTDYIRSYIGEKNASFSCLEDYISESDLEDGEGDENGYTFNEIMSIFTYIGTFFISICLGARYILVKVLILFSPVFFVFGGFKDSEKLFFCWCKKFASLIFAQVFVCAILGTINLCNSDNKFLSQILICGMLFLGSKNIARFLNLSY